MNSLSFYKTKVHLTFALADQGKRQTNYNVSFWPKSNMTIGIMIQLC